MFILCKSVGLFIEIGSWRMSRPKNPFEMERRLVEAGNEIYHIKDLKIEKKVVELIAKGITAPVYRLIDGWMSYAEWYQFTVTNYE